MLTNVPTEALLQKRQGLDNLAMMSTLNGVAVPDSTFAEMSAIEDELSRRGVKDLSHDAWSGWIGRKIDDFKIEHLLSESPHAYVLSATHLSTAEAAVFKIAKSFKSPVKRAATAQPGYVRVRPSGEEAADLGAHDSDAASQWLSSLSCNEIISRQIDQLNSVNDPSLVAIAGSGIVDGRQYYRMPRTPGMTLRQLIDLGKVPRLLQTFTELAQALRRLEHMGFRHGNLTAEHVFIRKGGVTLVSPGIRSAVTNETWSPGPTRPGPNFDPELNTAIFVTTCSYYPLGVGNDLLALGILFWEGLTLHHPLEPNDEKSLERRLAPPAVQALGLSLDADGRIDNGNFCRDYSAFIDVLQKLNLQG